MTVWQYKVFKFKPAGAVLRGGEIDVRDLEYEMNKFGRDGWEAVTALGSAVGFGATNEIAVVMKRPAPSP